MSDTPQSPPQGQTVSAADALLPEPATADGVPSGQRLRSTLWTVSVAWAFGSVWLTATSGAPLTLFAKGLGASNFQFGLLSALPFMASLASMPASLLIDLTGQRKRIFLWGLYLQRLMWLPIALVPLWMIQIYGAAAQPRAMGLCLVLMLIMFGGNAIGGPAWTSWMADIVPDRARGRYFARRRQLGILTAIPTAIAVGYLLDRVGAGGSGDVSLVAMRWIAALFCGAAVFGVVDIAAFHFVPNVPTRPRYDTPVWSILAGPLRDRNFLWFGGFVATLMFAVSFMGQFVTLYLIEKFQITNVQVQMMLLIAPSLGQLLVLALWGKAVDRMGKKPVLALAALGLVPVGLGWCLMGRGLLWLGYLLSAAGAALWSGVEVANFNLVLEMSASQDAPDEQTPRGTSYVAVNSIIINIAGMFGGLAAGVIADRLQRWEWTPLAGFKTFTFYELLFALSGFLRLVSVVIFLPHIHETGAKPAHHVLRYMTANIYNNLFNALMQPVRLIGVLKRDEQSDSEPADEP